MQSTSPTSRPPAARPLPARAWPLVLTLLAWWVLAPQAAQAQKLGVVVTDQVLPYERALAGFVKAWGTSPQVFRLPKGPDVPPDTQEAIRQADLDVVVAVGSQAATGLAGRLDGAPLVYCMVLDPASRGLSGPRVTGVRLDIAPGEQLRQFKRLIPKLDRVGVLFQPDTSGPFLLQARAEARRLGMTLVEVQVEGTDQVPGAVDRLLPRVEALWLIPDPQVITAATFKHMLEQSLRKRIPLLVFSNAFVKAGALAAVAPDYEAIGRETAELARQVAGRGAVPPSRYPPTSLVVNERTAARLGVGIDPSLRNSITLIK